MPVPGKNGKKKIYKKSEDKYLMRCQRYEADFGKKYILEASSACPRQKQKMIDPI
mgnify:CR=1 FL=1